MLFKSNFIKSFLSFFLLTLFISSSFSLEARIPSDVDVLDIQAFKPRFLKALKENIHVYREKEEDETFQKGIEALDAMPVPLSPGKETVLRSVGVVFGIGSAYLSSNLLQVDPSVWWLLKLNRASSFGLFGAMFPGLLPAEATKIPDLVHKKPWKKNPIHKNNHPKARTATKILSQMGSFVLAFKTAYALYETFDLTPTAPKVLEAIIIGATKFAGYAVQTNEVHEDIWARGSPGPSEVQQAKKKWENLLVKTGRRVLREPRFAQQFYDAVEHLTREQDQNGPPQKKPECINEALLLLVKQVSEEEDVPLVQRTPTEESPLVGLSSPSTKGCWSWFSRLWRYEKPEEQEEEEKPSKWYHKVGRFLWPKYAPGMDNIARLGGFTAAGMASGSLWFGSYNAAAGSLGYLFTLMGAGSGVAAGVSVAAASVSTPLFVMAGAYAASTQAINLVRRTAEGIRSVYKWIKRKRGKEVEPDAIRSFNPLLWSNDFSVTEVSNPIVRMFGAPASYVWHFFAGLPGSLLGGHEMAARSIPVSEQMWTLGPSMGVVGAMENVYPGGVMDRLISFLNTKTKGDEDGMKQTYLLRHLASLHRHIRTCADDFIIKLDKTLGEIPIPLADQEGL